MSLRLFSQIKRDKEINVYKNPNFDGLKEFIDNLDNKSKINEDSTVIKEKSEEKSKIKSEEKPDKTSESKSESKS